MSRSAAEILLAAQLEQAGIPFESEYQFAPEEWCREHGYLTPTGRPKRWRADFMVGQNFAWPVRGRYLVECEGAVYTQGRHTRGAGYEADLEKYNAAAEIGFRVLRYSTRQINDGTAITQIRRILSMKEERAA